MIVTGHWIQHLVSDSRLDLALVLCYGLLNLLSYYRYYAFIRRMLHYSQHGHTRQYTSVEAAAARVYRH